MLLPCLTSTIDQDLEAARLEALLQRIAADDSAALEALYRRTGSAIYGFALSILKNTHDAEDALHDCCIAIYTAAADYRPQGKPMAWIMTIVRNLCLQKLRERQKSADLPQEDWEAYIESRPEVTPEDRMVIAACMEQLTEQERQIVALHALAGFKHREIAAILRLPLPTVLSKYNRALKKLRQHLEGSRQP
jgi:RNA polymerase sigma-70 factor (ECF subfamily)